MNLIPPLRPTGGWTDAVLPPEPPFTLLHYPKITIITPSFKQGQYIEETIRSVLLQNYPNVEYLIFDGGSTDGTLEVLKHYDAYLTYWESTPDKGQSDAINKGMNRATGEIVNWLNSDDYYEPGALHHIARAFSDPNVSGAGGISRCFYADGTGYFSQGTDVYPELARTIGWARIDQPETFFRKSAWDVVGPLNPQAHFCMDKEWWLRYLLTFGQSHFVKIPNVIAHFRLHEGSKTVSQKEKFVREALSLFAALAEETGGGAAVFEGLAGETKYEKWNLRLPQKPDPAIVEAAFAYYLYYMACEKYELGEQVAAEKYFAAINPSRLAPEDQKCAPRSEPATDCRNFY